MDERICISIICLPDEDEQTDMYSVTAGKSIFPVSNEGIYNVQYDQHAAAAACTYLPNTDSCSTLLSLNPFMPAEHRHSCRLDLSYFQ